MEERMLEHVRRYVELSDGFLIEKMFEPVGHWFQVVTGRTCFWLAKMFLIWAVGFLFFSMVFAAWKDPTLFNLAWNVGLIIIGLWMLPRGWGSIHSRIESFEREWENYAPKTLNPMRIVEVMIYARLFLFFIALLLLMAALNHVWKKGFTIDLSWSSLFSRLSMVSSMLTFYFAACTPLPPNRLKPGNAAAASA